MGVTLNKDGTPRKVGSGKTKGAGCFANIKWQHLKNFIGEDEDIQVSRVWLRSVGALSQKKGSKKKVISASPRKGPSSSPTKNSSQLVPPVPPPARQEEEESEDDYTPPPCLERAGRFGIIKKAKTGTAQNPRQARFAPRVSKVTRRKPPPRLLSQLARH